MDPFKPFLPTVAFSKLSSNICYPRDCVSRHNGGTSGTPLKPLTDDRALRTLSSLKVLRGAPEVPPLCRETSVSRTANVGTVGMNGLIVRYEDWCTFPQNLENVWIRALQLIALQVWFTFAVPSFYQQGFEDVDTG